MLRTIFFLILVFHLFPAKAQGPSFKKYSLDLKLHRGFILMANEEVAHLANQHPTIIELDAYKYVDGSRAWHKAHRYPIIGYSLNLIMMDPSKPLGNMASVLVYLNKSLWKSPKSRVDFRIGFGPGYAGKPFDLHHNPKNNMISTHLNFCLNGRINYTYKIGRHLHLNTGLGIIHFSNGTVKLPNQGVNIPSLHVGLGFHGLEKNVMLSDTFPPLKKILSLDMMLSMGIKEEYPILGKKYLASTISVYGNKRMNRKSGLTLGLDFFYDPSITRFLNDPGLPFFRKTKIAITGGHELYFGKLSLLTQLGVHVFDPIKNNVALYERYGLKYKVGKSTFLQMTMKIFYGSVDYVEWGVGYRI